MNCASPTNCSDSDTADPSIISALLNQLGVAESYIDYSGNDVPIAYEDRVNILKLLDINIAEAKATDEVLKEIYRENALSWIPATQVITASARLQMPLNVVQSALDQKINWKITTEDKQIHRGSTLPSELTETHTFSINDIEISVRQLPLPELPLGYHQIKLNKGKVSQESFLIVTPERCYEPTWAVEGKKLCGVSVQLYSLRSNRNWGIGDFTDLKQLINKLATKHIDFVVLNPLHSLDANNPEHCSPYSPMDRRRLNPLYIDPQIELAFINNPSIQRQIEQDKYQQNLLKLHAPAFVDYTGVTETKYSLFAKMFSYFKEHDLGNKTALGLIFEKFIEDNQKTLLPFADFETAKNTLKIKAANDPLFHCYLQWVAERQLEECQELALASGMAIGLVRDMAIGGDSKSAEVALNPDLFCTAASIGAPPDPLAPQGQNWGLPPLKPRALKLSGYKHFIDLLRANMFHCGALRIDHILGFMRLWWCPLPDGSQEQTCSGHSNGAYVFYPVDDLFAILRLESVRQQCIVIGEDLGVVPPEIHSYMDSSGVFSNALFYFEKYDPVHFKHPDHFSFKSLAMIANHDVPTLAGWWNRSDLKTRKEIGLYNNDDEYNETLRARESDLIQILHWINEAGKLPSGWCDFNIHRPFDKTLCRALLEVNGKTAAQLVSAQLDDLCLTETPVNIPGTWNEYPNWRRKLPFSMKELEENEILNELLTAFGQSRRST